MRTKLLVFLIAVCTSNAFDYYRIVVNINGDVGGQIDNLAFGIDNAATYYIDEDLGERELPPFPPPGGTLYGVFILEHPDTKEEIWSYKDYRPVSQNSKFYEEYELRWWWGKNNELTFDWGKLGAELDSARFEYTIADVVIFSVDMKEQQTFTMDNISWGKGIFKMWFSRVTNVEEEQAGGILISPNPADEYITISNIELTGNLRILSLEGVVLKEITSPNYEQIIVSDLAKGIYFLEITGKSQKKYYRKFIKL